MKKKQLTKKAKRRLELRHDAARETKFLRVLDGWVGVVLQDPLPCQFIVSPKNNVYRHAAAWEKPSFVIDANILPVEHHIRLVKITNAHHCRAVRKQAKRARRMLGESHAIRRD